MQPNKKLQTKLLGSVCLIVAVTVVFITAVVTLIEKNRFQNMELERIYYETFGIKKMLGHLMYGNNWRYLMITLTNAKSANPGILYFLVTDNDGRILVADNQEMIGRDRFETAIVLDVNTPLFSNSDLPAQDQIKGEFTIHLSRLNKDIFDKTAIRASENEIIFEAFWDILYLGENMGSLRVGFSRREMKQYLLVLMGGMLGTGFLVLLVTLSMIYLVIRRNMRPLDTLIRQLSMLTRARDGQKFRDNLDSLDLGQDTGEVEEVQNLKQAFLKIKTLFVSNWDQLENHQHNLEKMVEARTFEINAINEKLVQEIREKKEIESRLLTVQKLEAVSTLAGGIAHEFNNLFMAITGYASLIQKHMEPGNPNIEKAGKIRQLVETGSQSIQQLLGFAKSGQYDPGPLNLNEVLRINLDIFSRSRKDLEIKTFYCKDIWTIHADRSQMEHVIMNLLLNASDAMPGQGSLLVETRNVVLEKKKVGLDKFVSGRFVLFCIVDQGRGIEQDVLPRVFDPFFTTKKMGAGVGMGLASVFGITENHGGFTTVQSRVGEGTRFCVYLPALIRESLE